MKKIIVLLLFICFNSYIFPYINIYPIKFDKNISSDVEEEFFLYNRTKENKKYRIYLENSEDSEFANWIEIYPKSILLKPLEEKSFKIYIKTPSNAEKGIYTTNLIVKEVESVEKNRDNKKTKILTKLKMKLIGRLER
ncbi:hypothetical protein [Cetobacterium sp.]